jgi:hypothetical protein
MPDKKKHMTYAFIGEYIQVQIDNLPKKIMVNGQPVDVGRKLSEVLANIDSSKGIISRSPNSPRGASKVAMTLLAFLTRGMYEFAKEEKQTGRDNYGSPN